MTSQQPRHTYLKIKLLSLPAEAREHLIETRVQRRPGRPARLIASENAPGEDRAAGARLDQLRAVEDHQRVPALQ